MIWHREIRTFANSLKIFKRLDYGFYRVGQGRYKV